MWNRNYTTLSSIKNCNEKKENKILCIIFGWRWIKQKIWPTKDTSSVCLVECLFVQYIYRNKAFLCDQVCNLDSAYDYPLVKLNTRWSNRAYVVCRQAITTIVTKLLEALALPSLQCDVALFPWGVMWPHGLYVGVVSEFTYLLHLSIHYSYYGGSKTREFD